MGTLHRLAKMGRGRADMKDRIVILAEILMILGGIFAAGMLSDAVFGTKDHFSPVIALCGAFAFLAACWQLSKLFDRIIVAQAAKNDETDRLMAEAMRVIAERQRIDMDTKT